MCRIQTALTAAIISISGFAAFAAEGYFLNVALLRLPPRYLADVPQKERGDMLSSLSFRDDRRLDYAHGWLHCYGDSGEISASSMLWLKLLPRTNTVPLVFVHMAKPFADSSVPAKNQTFILDYTGDGWRDVTADVLPKELDLTMHFRPRRKTAEIEIAPYEKVMRENGKGYTYQFGRCSAALVWNGGQFEKKTFESRDLSNDD